MKKYLTTIFLALGAVLIMGAGCQQITNQTEDSNQTGGAMMEDDKLINDSMMNNDESAVIKNNEDTMKEDDSVMKDDAGGSIKDEEAMMEESDSMMDDKQAYTGAVLAGNTAKLYDFNQADYEAALKSDKLVVLYFYANWCPICKAETADALYPAFNELDSTEVIGFRVNFNDSDTDSNEEELARQFGVAYQHTKVFVKDGERILKSPEGWDKARYLSEIEKNL